MKIELNHETYSLYQGTINSSENYKIKEVDGDYQFIMNHREFGEEGPPEKS